jgi:uncharacterized protein YgfB (UPF0149 family)
MNRQELTNQLRSLPHDKNASNLKFYKILKTRLTENDIKIEDAIIIAKNVDFDFSNVPEDNDSLSEFATELAEWCAKGYKQATMSHKIKDINEVVRFLVPDFKLRIDHL